MTFATAGQAVTPDPVTNFVVTPGDGKVTVGWTNPATPFDFVQLVRKAGSAPSTRATGRRC